MSVPTVFAPPTGIPVDVALSLSVIVETLAHGIYTCLFVSALVILLRRKHSNSGNGTSHWVFLIGITLMYLVASSHMVLTVYRFIRGYITHVDPRGGLFYTFDITRWENVVNLVLLCIMTWLGDALVIYRCYHVWDRKLWIIAVPALLLASTIGINSTTMYWFNHPLDPRLNTRSLIRLVNSIYPMAFAQNFLTTSLIAFKIWHQHRASSTSRVVDSGSRVRLIQVLRIVVESAMIYTVQILVIIILNLRNDNFQIVVQAAIVPSIGIVFVLIAVRVHKARLVAGAHQTRTSQGGMPTWLKNDDDDDSVSADAHTKTERDVESRGQESSHGESSTFDQSATATV